VLGLSVNNALGQEKANYYEIPLVEDQMIEKTIALDNSIIVSQLESYFKADYVPTRRYLQFKHDLTLLQDTVIDIPFRNKRVSHYSNDSQFYEFFYDYLKGNYSLVEVGDSGIQVEAGRFPNKLYEPQLVRTHTTKFILDKRVKKERVYVIQDDQEKGVSTSVSRMKKRTKVSALFFDVVSNSSDVSYIWRESSNRVDDVHALIWTNDGELLHRFSLQLPDKSIHSVSISQIDEDRYLVTGTYATYQTKMASGAFMAIIEDGAMMEVTLYSFSELPHYFDYLDRYEKEEMKRKMARLKKHEKSTEIRTQAICHPVKQMGESYLLAIEFYEESYTNDYGVTRNGNTIAGTPQTLKGYEYSHGTVLRFDLNGQLKHDYYLPIELEYLAKTKDLKLKSVVVGDTLYIGYAALNHLYFGNIKPAAFVSLTKESAVANEPDSVIRKEAKFTYLDDGRVLVYGFKTTKSGKGLNKKADIYFIETRKVR